MEQAGRPLIASQHRFGEAINADSSMSQNSTFTQSFGTQKNPGMRAQLGSSMAMNVNEIDNLLGRTNFNKTHHKMASIGSHPETTKNHRSTHNNLKRSKDMFGVDSVTSPMNHKPPGL